MRFFLIFPVLLMIASCVDRSFTPVVPQALNMGQPVTLLAGTTRAPTPNGGFGHQRSDQLNLMEMTVSIPPTHTPGQLHFGYANPNPKRHFTLAGQEELRTQTQFQRRLDGILEKSGSPLREVTLFVHGYNATHTETAFRAAQLSNDINLPGALMIYSWPSRGKPFGYAYDYDSVLFARDGLEQLIRQTKAAGVDRIVIVAHSMGSVLTMETMRQAEAREPGWAARTLGGVVLISPDLDIDLFRTQMNSIAEVPQPFIVIVSEKDRALNFSGRIRGDAGSKRLGNIDTIDGVADLPINVIDTTDFSADAQSSHFVAATSPTLIAMLNSLRTMGDTFHPEGLGLEYLLPEGADASPNQAHEIVLSPNGVGLGPQK